MARPYRATKWQWLRHDCLPYPRVEIEHVVPLANTRRSGAALAAWRAVNRESYANDPKVLKGTEGATNYTKGDKEPEASMPTNHEYRCEYACRWI